MHASDGVGEELAVAALALARRFNAGATLWAVSPAWPAHARHVAVEFVHPVVMGSRAFAAVAVEDGDPSALLRPIARDGDVIVAVATADDHEVRDLVERARAWGVTTVWLGFGPRPERSVPDFVVWRDDAPSTAPHDGSLVLLYHVLWELTQVCFEHPGLLVESEPDATTCTTCADGAEVAEIAALDGAHAVVRTATGLHDVDVSLVGSVQPHDLVLVHAGTAINRIGASDA